MTEPDPCVSRASPCVTALRGVTHKEACESRHAALHRGTGDSGSMYCAHCIVLYEVRLVLLEGGLSTRPGWVDM